MLRLRLHETPGRETGVEWRIVFAKTEDENVVVARQTGHPERNASPARTEGARGAREVQIRVRLRAGV